MPRTGTYYAGRIIKGGILNTEKVIYAILNPIPIQKRVHGWTIINAQQFDFDEQCIIGKLVKYNPQGEVSLVDNSKNIATTHIEPDMIVAESPFVYIPSYSGIAFLHVWNQIEQETFIKRFCDVICEAHDCFFTMCDIELISELGTFATKISSMSNIYKVSAKVHPPNPLFGRLWEDLKDYLIRRNTDSLNIIEENPSDKPIHSNLSKHVNSLINKVELQAGQVDISDAAVLMAADGYGRATVEGKHGDTRIVCKTTDNVKNFKLEREPDPEKFYNTAKKIFQNISNERYMEH